MRFWITFLCLLSLSLPASTLTVDCDLDDAAEVRATQLCELIRKEISASTTTWDLGKCCSEFFDRGLIKKENSVSTTSTNAQAATDLRTALNALRANTPAQWDPACPDGVEDTDLGETCDDNNDKDGDGCSAKCQRE